MKTWQLIKELAKGSGFYTKHFVFFASLVGLLVIGILVIKHTPYFASTTGQSNTSENSSNQIVNLEVTKDGRIIRNNKSVGSIELAADKDTLRYIVLDNPDTFIDSLQVTVKFDAALPEPPGTEYSVKATHYESGLDSSVNADFVDSHTLVYYGQSLSPSTIFTVYARFPKGVIQPPWWRAIFASVAQLPISTWFLLALILPIATLAILSSMLVRRWLTSRKSARAISDKLPGEIPPASVGVLIHGRIGSREIAATIISLAQRGYLHIFEDESNFYFGRGQQLESEGFYDLKPFERILLTKLFIDKSAKTSESEINIRLGQQLFSKKIAQVFLEIYDSTTGYGYFKENPGIVHAQYKFIGLSFVFVSFAGFLLNALFNRQTPLLLLFWAGMFVAAGLIIYFSPYMPMLTKKGVLARNSWLAFRNYLLLKKPMTYKEEAVDPYFTYLPYAIVLEVDTQWTKRCIEIPFHLPRWFGSRRQIASIEDFTNNLFPLIGFIAKELIVSRTPVVD